MHFVYNKIKYHSCRGNDEVYLHNTLKKIMTLKCLWCQHQWYNYNI